MRAVVRPAVPEDHATLAQLRRAWTEEGGGDPILDDGFNGRFVRWRDREADRRLFWLAVADGRAVGMVNLAVFDRMPRPGLPAARWGYVGNVFVLAPFRKLGLGQQLVDEVISHARDHGFVRLLLNPSERSKPLYTRAGFEPATALMVLPLGADA